MRKCSWKTSFLTDFYRISQFVHCPFYLNKFVIKRYDNNEIKKDYTDLEARKHFEQNKWKCLLLNQIIELWIKKYIFTKLIRLCHFWHHYDVTHIHAKQWWSYMWLQKTNSVYWVMKRHLIKSYSMTRINTAHPPASPELDESPVRLRQTPTPRCSVSFITEWCCRESVWSAGMSVGGAGWHCFLLSFPDKSCHRAA